jgi:hypothetical protein
VGLLGIIRGTMGYWERRLAALSDAMKQTNATACKKNQVDQPDRDPRSGEERL